MPKSPSKNKKSLIKKSLGQASSTPPFSVTIKCLNRVFTSTGPTFDEALAGIKISGGTNVMSVLRVERDGVAREKVINGGQTNRVFGSQSPTMKMIGYKWVKQLFIDLWPDI